MIYLKSFKLPTRSEEDEFILSYPPELEMQCYDNNNAYPFKLFPHKGFDSISFAPVTIFYGGNGSGKSTLLNIIAEKLEISRSAPFNRAPCFSKFLELCRCSFAPKIGAAIANGRIITSDDVFDFLLDRRAMNEGISERRESLFSEYIGLKNEFYSEKPFASIEDYESLKQRNEAKRKSMSAYTAKRLPREIPAKSNGESAYHYFTDKIGENALYLLDEPENSLSASLQTELLGFLEDSARFYNCQFIISTHSPFLLSLKDALVYDLDSVPVRTKNWTELENVRIYYDFFRKHEHEFR